ncbi:MAG: hypothetical protein HY755_06670 [Nitrospirae bacterium]|nr:hypothetical protein [Nitrospirota bacterium]
MSNNLEYALKKLRTAAQRLKESTAKAVDELDRDGVIKRFEFTFKLPGDLVETISNKEIIGLLMDKALGRLEYYQSRCNEFKEKYRIDFISFKKKVEKAKEESFTEWDDLMVWEGYELGYQEWKKKYEELKGCME